MQKAAKNSTAERAGAGRTCVLVIGMHRSGTSALTRVLSLLGCDLPKTLMEPHESNETGHWESVEIMKLDNEILNSAGSSWYDWLEFNRGWYTSPKAEEFKERALQALESEYGNSRLFVLKDPRICRFVPFWLDVLEAAEIEPIIIRQVRNPLEVAESLSKRSGVDLELGHLLWLRHVLDAEAGCRGRRRYQSSYERLLNDWPRLVLEMQDRLDISWPRLSVHTNVEISNFLTERLRHHQQSPEGVIANPFISSWLRDTFSIFIRWANEGENPGDHAELDRIRAELNASAPAFGRLVQASYRRANELKSARSAVEDQKRRLESLEVENRALAEKEASLGSEVADVRTQTENMKTELSQAQDALAQRSAEADEVRMQLHEAITGFDGLKAELSQTQSALAQRSAEADDVTAHLNEAKASLEAEKDLRRQEAERAAQLIGNLQAELKSSSAELEKLQSENDALDRSLSEVKKALRERSESLAEQEEERSRAIAEVDRLSEEKNAVEERLASRFEEIATLSRMLRDKELELASKLRLLEKRTGELTVQKRQLKEAEKSARAVNQQIALLREVSALVLNGYGSRSLTDRLAALLPASVRLKRHQAKLKAQGMFDPEAYLAANPDVAHAGLDPLIHYLSYGINERRKLNPTPPPKD